MIGVRAVASAALAGLVSAAAIGAGHEGPGPRLGADRLVRERADAALDALDVLDRALEPAVAAARRGSARIVSGDAAPGEQLERAASAVASAEPLVREVAMTLEALNRARNARDPQVAPIREPLAAGELVSIGAQLDAAATAGEEFAAMRRRADGVTQSLDAALGALERRDLDAAATSVATARRDHDALVAWNAGLDTLPVWIATTDAMIDAMETIVDATRAGDVSAARDAAAAIAALESEAAVADRALRIAVSEGGAAVASPALARLSAAVAAVGDARGEAAAVVEAEGR
jgi:hypothetical protein